MNSRPWPCPEADALLGNVPDVQIAAMYGIGDRAVRRRRSRLGIARHRVLPLDAYPLIGTDTDAEIARRFGCARRTVTTARVGLGIPCVPDRVSRKLSPRERIAALLDVAHTEREVSERLKIRIGDVRRIIGEMRDAGEVVEIDGLWVVA